MRHCHLLGCEEPHLYKFSRLCCSKWVMPFLNLLREKSYRKFSEGRRDTFKLTLDRGLKLLNEELILEDKKLFSGEVAFKLYDTYGFPLDLTEDVLRESNKKVDIETFDKKMKEQVIRLAHLGLDREMNQRKNMG